MTAAETSVCGQEETNALGKNGNEVVASRCTVGQWLFENTGVVRDLRGPGAWKYFIQLRNWHLPDYGEFLWKVVRGMCAPVALVHAIDALLGMHVAVKYRHKF